MSFSQTRNNSRQYNSACWMLDMMFSPNGGDEDPSPLGYEVAVLIVK